MLTVMVSPASLGTILTFPAACGKHLLTPAAPVSLNEKLNAELAGAAVAPVAAVTPPATMAAVAAVPASTRRDRRIGRGRRLMRAPGGGVAIGRRARREPPRLPHGLRPWPAPRFTGNRTYLPSALRIRRSRGRTRGRRPTGRRWPGRRPRTRPPG